MTQKNAKQRYKTGLWAEWRAKLYLRLRGYKIMAHRLRTPVGEIDVLARHGTTWVVVEIKYRKQPQQALYSIRNKQKQRLIKASLWVMSTYNLSQDTDFRFDAIFISPNHPITHVKNAWQMHE